MQRVVTTLVISRQFLQRCQRVKVEAFYDYEVLTEVENEIATRECTRRKKSQYELQSVAVTQEQILSSTHTAQKQESWKAR